MRDNLNIIPTSMAVLLHALLVAVMFVTVDLTGRKPPPLPLAIKGTLVTESAVVAPPPVEETPEPEPVVEPEPEPEPEEPEPEEPDPEEAARAAAEAEKRRQEKLIELQRLEELRRQREAEEELERKRAEAERERQEEIERQRAENERKRREAEAAMLQDAINEEADRLAARDSTEMQAYLFALRQKVMRAWARPASARPGLDCLVRVRQSPTGEVISATVLSCNGDAAVERSIEAAVYKASPLPVPENSLLFDPDLRFRFIPEQ